MAILFIGDTNASEAVDDTHTQIEQVVDANTLDVATVDIQSEVGAIAHYQESQSTQPMQIITADGDNDHHVIMKQLSWYQSYFVPPNYPLHKGQGLPETLRS